VLKLHGSCCCPPTRHPALMHHLFQNLICFYSLYLWLLSNFLFYFSSLLPPPPFPYFYLRKKYLSSISSLKILVAPCCAHGTFRCFELCSTCLKEGLGRSKPATNSYNKHINTLRGFLLYPSLTGPSSVE
jgi:hypothetical protein